MVYLLQLFLLSEALYVVIATGVWTLQAQISQHSMGQV